MRLATMFLVFLHAAVPFAAHAADNYPQRPIRLVVPVPPGGASDFTARIVGAKLTEMLGQNIVVENRGGAAGTIACDLIAHSAPDGYSLIFSSSTTHGIAPSVYKKLP